MTLRIFTDVSAVVDEADQRLGPTTTVRSSETTVITRDGQMVVIGGLIADENTDSDAGVPFLQDVPVLGYVFKRSTVAQVRRNLLTFITPRIIKDQFDARDTTISQRDKAGDLIQKNDVYPNRRDVLESDAIDHVAEKEQFQGTGPGTLLPPDGAAQNLGETGSAPEGGSSGKVRGTLSFKAKGGKQDDTRRDDLAKKLAEERTGQAMGVGAGSGDKGLGKPEQITAGSKAPSASAANSLSKSEVVINLKLLDTPKQPTALPFSLGSSSTLSIVIPKESLISTKEFFQVGSKYSYMVGNVELPMLVTSRSLSDSGSGASNSGTPGGQLYRLSPYEIMNLGKGPWLRR